MCRNVRVKISKKTNTTKPSFVLFSLSIWLKIVYLRLAHADGTRYKTNSMISTPSHSESGNVKADWKKKFTLSIVVSKRLFVEGDWGDEITFRNDWRNNVRRPRAGDHTLSDVVILEPRGEPLVLNNLRCRSVKACSAVGPREKKNSIYIMLFYLHNRPGPTSSLLSAVK